MNHEADFAQFERAVTEARIDSGKKKEMGRLLAVAIASARKTKRDIINACIANHATVDRWLAGSNVPHPNQVDSLKKILLGVSGTTATHPLTVFLLHARYRPVIHFLFEQESGGQSLDEGQVSNLLCLAEKSKGELSKEMMNIFLGFK